MNNKLHKVDFVLKEFVENVQGTFHQFPYRKKKKKI